MAESYEVLQLLKAAPEPEALDILRMLRANRDPSAVLAVLKDSTSSNLTPSEPGADNSYINLSRSRFEHELMRNYPTADVYCSRFLVHALMYWGTQMYTSLDESAHPLVSQFGNEAERLWWAAKSTDSLCSVAGAQLLSLAFMGNGRDHFVLVFLTEACRMARRMSLLGVEPTSLVAQSDTTPEDTGDPEWRFYFLHCVYGYESLRKSYRLAEAIGRALLAMTLRNGDITGLEARTILQQLKQRGLDHPSGDIRATFMGDLELAMTNPGEAKVETLAGQFEGVALFQEFIDMEATSHDDMFMDMDDFDESRTHRF
ncbi:hypothetical protein HYQ46_001399 [Verticillium longisporum]|nr:hypothetical protein HYQ46_001399 [Verticillium longisporum]